MKTCKPRPPWSPAGFKSKFKGKLQYLQLLPHDGNSTKFHRNWKQRKNYWGLNKIVYLPLCTIQLTDLFKHNIVFFWIERNSVRTSSNFYWAWNTRLTESAKAILPSSSSIWCSTYPHRSWSTATLTSAMQTGLFIEFSWILLKITNVNLTF